MGSNIINSNYKNYFLVDIYDMVLVDKKTKEIIISDTLTSCGIDCTTSSTTVQGGKGNAVLATLSSSKEITITTEMPTFNFDLLARQMGADIIKAAGKTMKIETLTLDEKGSATLSATPAGTSVTVFGESGKKTATALGGKITIAEGKGGDTVKACYEVNTTQENTEVVEINAKNFPTGVEMYLTSILIDNEENIVADITYHFPSVKMSADFSQSTASERDANPSTYTFTVIGNGGKLGTLEIVKREN